jgi:hypothetical protein
MLVNQQAQTEEDLEEAAFQAELGRDTVDAQAPAEETPNLEETQQSSQSEVAQEQEIQRVEVIPGYTKEEIDAALAEIPKLRSSIEKTNGTYGSRLADQQKIIDELRNQRQQQTEQVQQKISKLSPDKLSRLKKEYPEMAEILAEDLSEIIGEPQQSVDLSSVEQKFMMRLDEDRQARQEEQMKSEARLLKREHPDYIETAGYTMAENGLIQWSNAAFGNWVAAQPKDVQDSIINGDDALDLSDHITAYKNSLKQKKQTHLEKAIQPKGAHMSRSASSLDEEDRLFREELAREEY